MKRVETIKKLKVFLQKNYPNCQAFNCENIVGDEMDLVYEDGDIEVWYCERWDYLEIFGLTDREYNGLIKGTLHFLKTFRVGMTEEEKRAKERERWHKRYADPEFRENESGRSYERHIKYARSEKGKATKHRYYMAHREEILAKAKEKRDKNV